MGEVATAHPDYRNVESRVFPADIVKSISDIHNNAWKLIVSILVPFAYDIDAEGFELKGEDGVFTGKFQAALMINGQRIIVFYRHFGYIEEAEAFSKRFISMLVKKKEGFKVEDKL